MGLPCTADAVVIGGGILGTSTAHFLSKKGFGKVVLLEQYELAGVSTGHSAANIRTYYSNPVTAQLAWRSVSMFENDMEELGGDSGFKQVGFFLFIEQEHLDTSKRVFQSEVESGVDVQFITVDEAKDIAPNLEFDRVVRVMYEPRSGYADPVKTTRSLANKGLDWGLELHEGVGATGIELRNDRVVGVTTDLGFISTPVVVNSAGPWGGMVGNWVNLNYSIRWSREAELVIDLPHDFGNFPVVSDPNLRFYFRPHGNAKVLAGLGYPKEVEPLKLDNYEKGLDTLSRHRIMERLIDRIPILEGVNTATGWASVYTITDDWHPLVGSEDNLTGYYACFAGSGHSFKIGPPIGEALADVIAGDIPSIDITPLRPGRFLDGEPIVSAWGIGNRG
jgi:sarcosine oxidase subunit beta